MTTAREIMHRGADCVPIHETLDRAAQMMRDKQVASIDELFDMARQMGVKLIACTMSMDVMGITREELIDGVEVGGVATFLGDAARSRVSLFV